MKWNPRRWCFLNIVSEIRNVGRFMNWKNIIILVLTLFVVVIALYMIGWKRYANIHDEEKRQEQIEAYVSNWINKRVETPIEVGLFTTNGDSIDAYFPTEHFKIVRYIGKDGCSSCKLHLSRYPEILKELSDSAKCPVGFVCIINPSDMAELRRILHRDNYAGLTMWIDETDTINSLNQFPEIESLQTFLLDKDNRVLAIGDPAVNPRVMRLYTQILSNDTINPARLPYTVLSVANDEIQIGKVVAGDTIHIPVRVHNVGNTEFVLDKVITSCDCTTAELSSESIAPGESAMLTIHFSEPDAIGDFYRVVDIFGNTEQELSIEFYGTIKQIN